MLELKNISKYYNAGTVNEMCLFNDFNLSIDDGEFVSVVGSNGSGKTSMLNLICGSIPVDSGTIVMGGTDITKMPEYKRQRRIGRVIYMLCSYLYYTMVYQLIQLLFCPSSITCINYDQSNHYRNNNTV